MLTLRGAPALSAFRLDKLAQKFSAIHPDIKLLHTEYVHFAELHQPLAPERQEILASLLTYGPDAAGWRCRTGGRGITAGGAAPRHDIALVQQGHRYCAQLRPARGRAPGAGYRLVLRAARRTGAARRDAVAALVHDRMTETVLADWTRRSSCSSTPHRGP